MDLNEIRLKIDKIDDDLVKLFQERMKTVASVAMYKRSQNLPVYDAAREEKKIEMVRAKVDESMEKYVEELYRRIFELSREYEQKLMDGVDE